MRKFFIAICFIATFFDCVAVMLGLCVSAKVKTDPGYAASSVGALIVVGLLLTTRDIWRNKDAVHRAMRFFWGLALCVNITAVFLTGANHIILERPISDSTTFNGHEVYAAGFLQLITVVVFTIFLTGAPVAVSHLWRLFYEEEEDELPGPNAEKSHRHAPSV
jgi:hypothetical protein